MSEDLIIVALMAFMGLTAIALARLRNLFAVVMLSGLYSLLAAVIYVVLDAVDVAFTEAAVGAGIATVLMLATLALTTNEEKVTRARSPVPVLLVLGTGALLIYGTLDMPAYGDPSAPIHQHVAPRYLERSGTETGISQRGHLGSRQLSRLRHLGRGVRHLHGRRRRAGAARPTRAPPTAPDRGPRSGNPMRRQPVLRVIAKLLIPPIMVFALYVQFHGDFGPGGGFQAGVIFASAFILYALVFGVDTARRVAPSVVTRAGLAAGVLLYGGVGLVGLALGGNYLDYSVLAGDPNRRPAPRHPPDRARRRRDRRRGHDHHLLHVRPPRALAPCRFRGSSITGWSSSS